MPTTFRWSVPYDYRQYRANNLLRREVLPNNAISDANCEVCLQPNSVREVCDFCAEGVMPSIWQIDVDWGPLSGFNQCCEEYAGPFYVYHDSSELSQCRWYSSEAGYYSEISGGVPINCDQVGDTGDSEKMVYLLMESIGRITVTFRRWSGTLALSGGNLPGTYDNDSFIFRSTISDEYPLLSGWTIDCTLQREIDAFSSRDNNPCGNDVSDNNATCLIRPFYG